MKLSKKITTHMIDVIFNLLVPARGDTPRIGINVFASRRLRSGSDPEDSAATTESSSAISVQLPELELECVTSRTGRLLGSFVSFILHVTQM